MAPQSPTSTPANPRSQTTASHSHPTTKARLQKLDKHLDNDPPQSVMRVMKTNLAVTSRHALNRHLLNKRPPLSPLPRSGNNHATSCSRRGGSISRLLLFIVASAEAGVLPGHRELLTQHCLPTSKTAIE